MLAETNKNKISPNLPGAILITYNKKKIAEAKKKKFSKLIQMSFYSHQALASALAKWLQAVLTAMLPKFKSSNMRNHVSQFDQKKLVPK